MKKEDKLVSVFIPYYNDAVFLGQCIDSVLAQTYTRFELVLLDHASTDESPQIAHGYDDPRIRHISLERNLGAGGGLLIREFLDVAQGDYFKLFCADDMMHPDCLEKFVVYMETHPQTDVVFGNIEYVDDKGKPLGEDWFHNRYGFDSKDGKFDLLRKYSQGSSVLPYIGNFVRREAFAGIHLNKTFIMVFDMTLWVDMIFRDKQFAFMDEVIACYRLHKNQISSVHTSQVVSARSFYETLAYPDLFYSRIKDVATLKQIYPNSPFPDRMDDGDTDLIEFVIAHSYFIGDNLSYKMNAYQRLERIMSDDTLRERIWTKFSYGIKEFRDEYTGVNTTARKKLYVKDLRDFSLAQIGRIFLSSLWHTVYINNVKRINNIRQPRNKRYSM